MANESALLDECTRVFNALDMPVRREHLAGNGGGLCVLRGKTTVFIDLDADLATQVATCVRVLAGVERVEGMFLTPALRERIDDIHGHA